MPTLATCSRNFFSGPYEIFGSLHRQARPNISYNRVEGSPLGQGEHAQIDSKGLGQLDVDVLCTRFVPNLFVQLP